MSTDGDQPKPIFPKRVRSYFAMGLPPLMGLAMNYGLSSMNDTFGKHCAPGATLSETALAGCLVATEVRHVGAVLLTYMIIVGIFAFWRSAATD